MVSSLPAVVAAYCAAATAGPAQTQTNFVLMMSDDTGWGDPSYNGGTATTPHLDQWAAADSAIRFERFYAGSPICSPTRSSFLTGRTPWRDCIFNVEYRALSISEADHYTVASAAKSKGYRTAHFGKWHLGSLADHPPRTNNGSCGRGPPGTWCAPHDGSLPVANPTDFGFDTFCSTPQCAPSASANCVCAQAAAPGQPSLQHCNTGHYGGNADAMVFPCQQYYYTSPATGGGANVTAWPVASKDDDNEHLVDRFEDFMNASLAESKPFLAVIWFHSVHIPYVSPVAFRAQYAAKFDANEADYYGALTAMDAQIGRIRAMLRDRGVADDTLLIYTADNGPEGQWIHHPSHPGTNPGSTNGLRGRKRDLTEGGIREPGLLEWPRMIKANLHTTTYPSGTVDIKPTVMDIIGVTPPADWPLDGASLLPLIQGKVATRSKPMGWVWGMVYGNRNSTGVCGAWRAEQEALRRPPPASYAEDSTEFWQDDVSAAAGAGDQDANQAAWQDGSFKLFACNSMDGQPLRYFLYNLETDAEEKVDLSSQLPAQLAKMKVALTAWIASVAVSRGPTETNCAAAGPTPPGPSPPGPFTPIPGKTNCTYVAGKTMPGSKPVKVKAASAGACCGLCFETSWCVVAIFADGSCNMHPASDVKPIVPGGAVAVLSGRAPII